VQHTMHLRGFGHALRVDRSLSLPRTGHRFGCKRFESAHGAISFRMVRSGTPASAGSFKMTTKLNRKPSDVS
jgi:hypothetical protein